jgi:hypothetical protein
MTGTLGPTVVRTIVIRLLIPNVAALGAAFAAALYHRNWGWLGVGGTIITAYGAFAMSARLLRLGPARMESSMPPTTLPGGQFNFAYLGEGMQRAAENWYALVGFWITIAGTIVAGALPFMLDALAPFARS